MVTWNKKVGWWNKHEGVGRCNLIQVSSQTGLTNICKNTHHILSIASCTISKILINPQINEMKLYHTWHWLTPAWHLRRPDSKMSSIAFPKCVAPGILNLGCSQSIWPHRYLLLTWTVSRALSPSHLIHSLTPYSRDVWKLPNCWEGFSCNTPQQKSCKERKWWDNQSVAV